jgi:hypothetical protein
VEIKFVGKPPTGLVLPKNQRDIDDGVKNDTRRVVVYQ